MSQGDNSPGLSRLAGAMRKISGLEKDDSLILDFGTINSDGSLKTDSFPAAIPKGDYFVCRHLKGWETSEVDDHQHVIPAHSHGIDAHSHNIPNHTHGATASSETLSAQSNGGHSHSVSTDSGTYTTGSAGEHGHTINAHSHSISVEGVTQQTESVGLTTQTESGRSTEPAGKHKHKSADEMTLKTGDRVLVAWVQSDAVVVDVILRANELL